VQAVIDASPGEILERARADGRRSLNDEEAFALAQSLGFGVPALQHLPSPKDLSQLDLTRFAGDRVVVKIASSEHPHKTEIGGVRVVPRDAAAIRAAIEEIQRRVDDPVDGFTVFEFVEHGDALGAQLLLGCRWTDDMGPVVTIGPGGLHAEFLSRHLEPGRTPVILSPALSTAEHLTDTLADAAFVRLAAGHVRGGVERVPLRALTEAAERLLYFLSGPEGKLLAEFEVNPAVYANGRLVALDALARLRHDAKPEAPPRPLHKISRLLTPQSIALVGVSERDVNPGRVILQNLLREGFPRDSLFVIRANATEIDGVRCVPDLAALPHGVDLLVVSVAADRVPSLVEEVVREQRAESIIVIPGGLGERAGSERLEDHLLEPVHRARDTRWGGPVINGGNCLGVRSVPGRVDTMFIPDYKLPARPAEPAPVALISQSGALAVARTSALTGINARFVVSVGNQSDLTVGDYLTYLADDPDVRVFGCYLEGFKPGDGRRWLEATARITASGRDVIVYRAGRTVLGTLATASHTAAIAGDYAVFRALAEQAGASVADSLGEFDALLQTAARLADKRIAGRRLGAVSNAGFECVAMTDALGHFTLASLGGPTTERLATLLDRYRLQGVVAPGNPLDLTPIVDDAGFASAVETLLADDGVDVAVVGCVPLTGALTTLPAAPNHDEDLDRADALAPRLVRIARDHRKAWVAVVDGGPQYDTFAARLLEGGVPTFRSVDRAMRVFDRYCTSRVHSHSQG